MQTLLLVRIYVKCRTMQTKQNNVFTRQSDWLFSATTIHGRTNAMNISSSCSTIIRTIVLFRRKFVCYFVFSFRIAFSKQPAELPLRVKERGGMAAQHTG